MKVSKDIMEQFLETVRSGKGYNIAWSQRNGHELRLLQMMYADIRTKIVEQNATSDKPLKFAILSTEKRKAHSESMREKLIQMLTYSQLADKVSIEVVTPKTAND